MNGKKSALLVRLVDLVTGEDGDFWLEVLDRCLRKENPWPTIGKPFGTVMLGEHKTVAKLREAVVAAGHEITTQAEPLLDSMLISKKKRALDLFVVTNRELGADLSSTCVSWSHHRLELLGFERVPAEAVVLLRILFRDQALGAQLLPVMDPIEVPCRAPHIFRIERDADDGRSYLHAIPTSVDETEDPDACWVVARIRPSRSRQVAEEPAWDPYS